MRRRNKRKTEDQTNRQAIILPLSVALVLIFGVVWYYNIGTRVPELDDRLCPKDTGPVGATVLLLDTSDPLTPKHRAELNRLARQIKSDDSNQMGTVPGELITVYDLQQNPASPKKLISLCRPYIDPKDRTWRDDIHQGRLIAQRDWEHFEKALDTAFPEYESVPQPTSPLLETIAVLAARHVPGKRGDRNFKVHIIIFSDLLQHSTRLSHYETYPDAKVMRQQARDLITDLTGVQVSLFRLERPKYAQWQTEHHYYWWTEFIQEQGGQIEWQDTI